jgi:hypothetical protein
VFSYEEEVLLVCTVRSRPDYKQIKVAIVFNIQPGSRSAGGQIHSVNPSKPSSPVGEDL